MDVPISSIRESWEVKKMTSRGLIDLPKLRMIPPHCSEADLGGAPRVFALKAWVLRFGLIAIPVFTSKNQ
jgi:hypothetical protein